MPGVRGAICKAETMTSLRLWNCSKEAMSSWQWSYVHERLSIQMAISGSNQWLYITWFIMNGIVLQRNNCAVLRKSDCNRKQGTWIGCSSGQSLLARTIEFLLWWRVYFIMEMNTCSVEHPATSLLCVDIVAKQICIAGHLSVTRYCPTRRVSYQCRNLF